MSGRRSTNLLIFIVLCASVCGGWLAADDPPRLAERPLAATWEGILDAGMQRLRFILHLSRDAKGALRATVDSPDQGAFGLPVDSAKLEGSRLQLKVPVVQAEFDGRLNDRGDELGGTWRQGGGMFPLKLKAVAAPTPVRRPQLPVPPFPYLSEDVTFASRAQGITLAGTFTCPKAKDRVPAVVLISGSGPQDRDETLFGHKPFLVLADHLSRHGIAVLRFDDRGVGGSSHGPDDITTRDFAEDALGAVAWLAARPEVDRRRIGIIGHSEGGQVALFGASASSDVAFVVMLAGSGLPGERLLDLQTAAISRAAGVPEAQIAALQAINRQAYAIAKEPGTDAAARLTPLFDAAGMPHEAQAAQVQVLLSPWFRFFVSHDPAEDLAQLRVPLLALAGDKDVQVVAAPHIEAMRKALDAAGHRDHTLTILPGLNHLFQECRTGGLDEYGAIEQTMAPVVLETIASWIPAHVPGHAAEPTEVH